jgi:hypothetical protein
MHRKLTFRRDTRLEGSFPAEISSVKPPIAVRCLDISRGGAYLEGEALPVGSELQVWIELAPFLRVTARGVVVYQGDDGPPGVGIRFVDLDAGLQHEVRAFVETMRPHDEPLAVAGWLTAAVSTH